ncbi:MarR family transcriptional regulator [Fusibacter paucivorans]|uniref:MarR family transcriptional regulator n=1 Tax=Fusibacter paucivorans TaxID=76009 RepID=A0ABS5PR22_9FIRM|nr:MarR family transcriptional regulator [Fusibacter paucivorans]MBS7527347.1 MarR family transcriptional regulator [Fusibacter paucivorans]
MDEKMARIEEDLRRVCYKIKKKGREILSDFDITPPQFEALQFLINDERLTISELSTNMFLACSTVTDLLDRMERNELVKRVKDDQDRRIVRIMVLPKGHELLNKVIETRIRYIEAMLSDIDEATRESIESSVRILNERVEI